MKNIAELVLLADSGDINAVYELGLKYLNMRNIQEAVKYFKIAADKGNVSSQFQYGELCLDCMPPIQNYQDAFKYLKLAADRGYMRAEYKLYFMYMNGLAGEKNEVKALKYLESSAKKGYQPSLTELEQINTYGKLRIEGDSKKAMEEHDSLIMKNEMNYGGYNENFKK